jgi:CHAT domain-containing protein
MVKHFKKHVVQSISVVLVLALGLGSLMNGAIAQVDEGGGDPRGEPSPGGDTPAPGGDAPAPGGDAPAPGGDAPAPGGDAPAPATPGLEDTTSPNPSESPPSLDDATHPPSGEVTPNYPNGRPTSIKTPTLVGSPVQIIEQIETYQSQPYANHLGLNLYGELTNIDTITQTLQKLAKRTGTNPALVYVLSTGKGLKLVLVLPGETPKPASSSFLFPHLDLRLASTQPWRFLAQQSPPPEPTKLLSFTVPEANAGTLKRMVKTFRNQVSDPQKSNSTSYQTSAKQLYEWMIAPLKPTLEARRIDTLVFSLDKGLRTMPIAALSDGKQFLVEQYNLAIIPSFSLTDTRFQEIRGGKMLGMGITQSAGGLPPLPAVSVEVPTLTQQIWQGTGYLDNQVTLQQFQSLAQREQFSIIHLATHAEFNPGNVNQSFIQFWDGRLTLPNLRKIALNQKWSTTPTLELLVLSACQTALGNDQAELGFTGLAVQTGVKTAIGSLWSVSDEGSLGLMSEFYRNLKTAPIRAAALRNAQVGMLRGQVKVANGKLQLTDGTQVTLPAAIAQRQNINLTHPYFWSAFTVVGNWN